MPAPADLRGRRFGRLTVLTAGDVPEGRKRDRMLWHVRCDCGREEAYAQYRLVRGEIEACSHCRGYPCAACGTHIPMAVGARSTCSAECRVLLRRDQWRLHARQKAIDDPEGARRRHDVRKRRAETDETMAAHLQELERARSERRQKRMATDPAYAERSRAGARLRYTANAEDIQARRKKRLAEMSVEQLESWLEKMRGYGRDFAARHRADRARDPARQQAYIDAQAEYRRRRNLSALLGEATKLTEEKPDE